MFTIAFHISVLHSFYKLLALPWTALVIAMLGYRYLSPGFLGDSFFLAPLYFRERGGETCHLPFFNEWELCPHFGRGTSWWQGRSSLNFGHNLTVVHYPAALLQWYTPFPFFSYKVLSAQNYPAFFLTENLVSGHPSGSLPLLLWMIMIQMPLRDQSTLWRNVLLLSLTRMIV